MAQQIFNPPPGWPVPPAGWQPPPGWQPDPAWGPAPEGWSLFVRPNPHPFAWAFGIAGALYAVLLLAVGLSGHLSAEGAGAMLGGIVLLPGLVVGLIARRSGSRWASWRYLLLIVLIALVLSVLRNLPGAAPKTA